MLMVVTVRMRMIVAVVMPMVMAVGGLRVASALVTHLLLLYMFNPASDCYVMKKSA
jgi:hypothetical protein